MHIFVKDCTKLQNFPFVLGREGAGYVVKVGAKVTKFNVGQRVAFMGINSLYEYKEVDEMGNVVKLPDILDFKTAGACFLQGLTALTFVREAYQVKKGDYILIHAAAGGTGSIMAQLASHFGAHVIGTTSSAEKAEIAKKYGAQYIINYRTENVEPKVKEITNGKGVIAVYDGIGKDTWDVSLSCLSNRGTMVSFGNASGVVPPLTISTLSPKNLKVLRPAVFGYLDTHENWNHYANELIDLITAGHLTIPISNVYPVSEFATALSDLESGQTTGKLAIEW